LNDADEQAVSDLVRDLSALQTLNLAQREARRTAYEHERRESIHRLWTEATGLFCFPGLPSFPRYDDPNSSQKMNLLSKLSAAQFVKRQFNTLREWQEYWRALSHQIPALCDLVRKDIEELESTGSGPHCAAARNLANVLRDAGRADVETTFLRAWINATPHGDSKAYRKLVRRLARLSNVGGL
jgi:hypothetical protein